MEEEMRSVASVQLQSDLKETLRLKDPFDGVLRILQRFRDNGGQKEEASFVLEELRHEVEEDQEDVLLEALDRISGWCRPELRIWDI